MVEIRRIDREAVAVLEVAGRLDVTTSSRLDDAINGVFDTNYRALVIDCSGLKYVSSSGLRVLLLAARRFGTADGRLVLCGVEGPIRKVFDISGFSSIFSIEDTQETALSTFPKGGRE